MTTEPGLKILFVINPSSGTKSNFIFKHIADLSRVLDGRNENTSVNFTEVSSLVAPKIQNMNGLLEGTKELARIWDLYGVN